MSSIRNKLVGRWRLVSYIAEAERSDPVYPLGPAAKGVLDYSPEGNVSVHIMGAGYFAYYGYYTVDEKAATVTHHLELCSDRNLAGVSNLRRIRLEDGRLVLSGSMTMDGRAHDINVVWEREPAIAKSAPRKAARPSRAGSPSARSRRAGRTTRRRGP